MSEYIVYYIDSECRVECMLVCSLNTRIDWCEEGLKMASWKYNEVARGESDSLNDIFRRHSVLDIDRRRKQNRRAIGIGDVIVLGDQPWIVTAFGFARIPDILWDKMMV